MNYIVYALIDPNSGIPFYVGKSHKGFNIPARHLRASHQAIDKNADKLRAIAKCMLKGHKPEIWPIAWAKTPKELAQLESQIIRQWTKSGVKLTNRTNNRAILNERY